MSRYYSLETIRDNAYDVTLANGAKNRCIDLDALLDIEPADVRENVRGEWIKQEGSLWPLATCSVCGELSVEGDKPFCSNCGAENRVTREKRLANRKSR